MICYPERTQSLPSQMELITLRNGTQLVPQNVYKFQFQSKNFQLMGNFFPDFETSFDIRLSILYDYMTICCFRQDAFIEKDKTMEMDDTEKEVAEWLQQLDGGRGALVAW